MKFQGNSYRDGILLHRKQKILWTVFMAGLLFGCGPRFSGEEKEVHSDKLVLVAVDGKTNETLAAAVVFWPEECTSEKSDTVPLSVMATWPNEIRPDKELTCSNSRFIAGSELRELLTGHGYRSGEEVIGQVSRPFVGSNAAGWFRERDGHYDYYLAYNESCVSLVRGTYGNREGAEIEHSYCIESDFFTTERSIMRVVHLEPFADF